MASADVRPGSRRAKGDLHPAVLPPRPHQLLGCEPIPRYGVVPGAGVLVLHWQRGRPRGGQQCIPHGVYPRDRGPHRAICRTHVRGDGEGFSPRERHRTVMSWVTLTQWPPDSSSSASHPSIRSARRWGLWSRRAGWQPRRSGRGGDPGPKGAPAEGQLSGMRAIPLVEAAGSRVLV